MDGKLESPNGLKVICIELESFDYFSDITKWAREHEYEPMSMSRWVGMDIFRILWWHGQNIFRISLWHIRMMWKILFHVYMDESQKMD